MQPVLPVLVVPKDVTPERVHVSIIDTPGQQSEVAVAKVDGEISTADVIVLVYDVSNEESTKRIPTYWLKRFRSKSMKVPIILVGNKIDTRGGIADPTAAAKMEEFIKPIMEKYREVDVCIECSAKTVSNISEVFYFAQKAVLYPTGLIYDVETHLLKPPAAAALRRIFKMCDKDNDGGLNDKELNDFQYKCFNIHLQPPELEGVKKVVQESRPTNGLNRDGSLSVEGFIFLHTLFVQKGRLETTWIVLRKFGYDDDMRLSLPSSEKLERRDDQSVELSQDGMDFVGNLFAAADKDADGMLSPAELKSLFRDCPDGAFGTVKEKEGERLTQQCEESGKTDYVTFESFMARWAMYVMDDTEDAMVTMMYLGYQSAIRKAFKVTRSRKRDRGVRSVGREVVNVNVLGSEGGLRSDVVRGLVGVAATGVESKGVVAGREVELSESERKTLVMRSVSEEGMRELFLSRGKMEAIDVMCLSFSASSEESFEQARAIWETLEMQAGIKIPVVFVACVEGDEGAEGKAALGKADAFCVAKNLPTPTRVSLSEGEFGNLYEDLVGVAMYPQVACADYYSRSGLYGGEGVRTAVRVAAGVAVGGLVLYGAKRLYDYYTTKGSSSS